MIALLHEKHHLRKLYIHAQVSLHGSQKLRSRAFVLRSVDKHCFLKPMPHLIRPLSNASALTAVYLDSGLLGGERAATETLVTDAVAAVDMTRGSVEVRCVCVCVHVCVCSSLVSSTVQYEAADSYFLYATVILMTTIYSA